MYLNRIIQLGLLDPTGIEPHVLNDFPISVARNLVKSISDMILGNRRNSQSYTTAGHIDWILQVLAHGFALPLTDASLIESCVMIYSQWLLENHSRPAYLATVPSDERQVYIRRLLLHLSQIFEFHIEGHHPSQQNDTLPKDNLEAVLSSYAAVSAGTIQRYVDLCKHVTALYASIGRALGPKMTPETWKTLLSCLLAAIDNLIGQGGLASNQKLSSPAMTLAIDVLCDPLLRTFMELWLKSQSQDVTLWNTLVSCFPTWSQKSLVIEHWNAVTLGLSRRLMAGLYSPTTNDELYLNTFNYNLTLPVSHTTAGFLWYQFLFLLRPHPDHIPPNLTLILQGINQIVMVLSQGDTGMVPAGNTLLRIVGPWLFKACLSPVKGTSTTKGPSPSPQEEGSVPPETSTLALNILCRIFTQRPYATFTSHYREILLQCLRHGLSHEVGIQAIIIHGGELLGQVKIGLELLPHFLEAAHKLIPKSSGIRLTVPIDQLRRGILYAISAGYLLPKRFPTAPIPPHWPPIGYELHLPRDINYPTQVTSFQHLTPYILQTLFQFLSSETDPVNFRLTLNLLLLQVAEASPRDKLPLAMAVLRSTLSQILRSGSDTELALICLEAVKRLIIAEPEVAREKALESIGTLSHYVITLLDEEDFKLSQPLLISTYTLFAQWIASANFSVPTEMFSHAIGAICRGLAVDEVTWPHRTSSTTTSLRPQGTLHRPGRSGPTHRDPHPLSMGDGQVGPGPVSLAARLALNSLLYFRRPPPTFDDLTLARQQLQRQGETAVQYFFIAPDTLITIVEDPTSPQATVIMRDSFVKMVWNTSAVNELQWSESSVGCLIPLASPVPPNPTPLRGHSYVDTVVGRTNDSPPSHSRSPSNLDGSDAGEQHPLNTTLMKLIESQRANEAWVLKRPTRTDLAPVIPPPAPLSHHLIARQFLLQLGIIGPNSTDAIPLPLTSTLVDHIETLDGLAPRHVIPVTLLYSPSLASPPLDPPTSLPLPFQELASHLSAPWKSTHSDPFTEIALTCPYLRPDSSPTGDPTSIVIIYLDAMGLGSKCHSPHLPTTLQSHFDSSTLILVIPESDHHFRIRLAAPSLPLTVTPWVGPLTDDIVVSRTSWCHLLRATLFPLHFTTTSHPYLYPSLTPHLTRHRHLHHLPTLPLPPTPTASPSVTSPSHPPPVTSPTSITSSSPPPPSHHHYLSLLLSPDQLTPAQLSPTVLTPTTTQPNPTTTTLTHSHHRHTTLTTVE